MTQTHCAKFSTELFTTIHEFIGSRPRIYDPMAGTGERLRQMYPNAILHGSEIEPEYAAVSDWIVARDLRDYHGRHKAIVTSPPYGNRMADQYLGTPAERALRAETGKKPRRNSYAIDLGRPVTEGSPAGLQWGERYRETMSDIWRHIITKNMEIDGVLVVNVASHFRDGQYQPVAEWTADVITEILVCAKMRFIPTPGLRDGQNSESRVGGEMVYLFEEGR